MKTFKVNTVQDMIDCTNENNLDNFLVDLKKIIEAAHYFRELTDNMAEKQNISKKLTELKSKGFEWIDDSKHEITIELSSK